MCDMPGGFKKNRKRVTFATKVTAALSIASISYEISYGFFLIKRPCSEKSKPLTCSAYVYCEEFNGKRA